MSVLTNSLPSVVEKQKDFTIGALAKACGVTVRALRYYEEMGLIRPVKRTSGKYRLYNQRSFKRVSAILALQALNYSLDEILQMLGEDNGNLVIPKSERVVGTQKALKTQQALVKNKLVSLQRFKHDIDQRMNDLAQFCEPCLDNEPESNCCDGCDHRDVHFS